MRRLRVLAVCDDPPVHGLPTSAGHTLIAAELLPRLGAAADVTVAYYAEEGVEVSLPDVSTPVHLPLQRRSLTQLHLPDAVSARLAPAAVRAVARLSESADVTYLHGLGTFGLLRALRSPAVANEIDPLSLFWTDRVAAAGLRSPATRLRAGRLRRLERATAAQAAGYLVVNPQDAEALSYWLDCPVQAIPNGVWTATAPPRRVTEPRIAFVGSLDYEPNVDSAVALCRDVLPVVRRTVPAARVTVAGRRPTAAVQALAGDGVDVIANPDDLRAVLRSAAVAAFPGGYGRGTRNSVLDAIRCGVPVVASTASARGIPHGRHLTVADDPLGTADAIVTALQEGPDGPQHVAARAAAPTLPSWDDVAQRYLSLLSAVVQKAPTRLVPRIDSRRAS